MSKLHCLSKGMLEDHCIKSDPHIVVDQPLSEAILKDDPAILNQIPQRLSTVPHRSTTTWPMSIFSARSYCTNLLSRVAHPCQVYMSTCAKSLGEIFFLHCDGHPVLLNNTQDTGVWANYLGQERNPWALTYEETHLVGPQVSAEALRCTDQLAQFFRYFNDIFEGGACGR